MDINDRNTLITLLDQALSSKEDTVKALLQSLLVTVSLVHAEDKSPQGPLAEILNSYTELQDTIRHMNNRIIELSGRIKTLESIHNTQVAKALKGTKPTGIWVDDDYDVPHRRPWDMSENVYDDSYKEIVKRTIANMKNKR